MIQLAEALGLEPDQSPFPWQHELLDRLKEGVGPQFSLDVPTGLGKTSAMAAWLVALTEGATLPRRLVYIVDRRAVVDQATTEAVRLRDWIRANPEIKRRLKIAEDGELPISTLRGQFTDNREWLSNPASPAIVVGTVDMVGSRLLFEGYGVSRKMRPYHAGFLGADTLFVLDEAHLVPPFERLLERVVNPPAELRGDAEVEFVPRPALLSLSATGRGKSAKSLGVTEADLSHPVAGQRLRAKKRLVFVEPPVDESNMADRLAAEAWDLSGGGTKPCRIIVFCNSRDTAAKVNLAVIELAKGKKKEDIEEREIATQLFVGARRVRERQQVADWLEEYGFIAGAKSQHELPTFVFSTSAGAVGVDLDADQMAGDLVSYERMTQRLGRVNRRGEGDAEVRILLEEQVPSKKKDAVGLRKALEKPERIRTSTEHALVRQYHLGPKYLAALQRLPRHDDESFDASPNAFRILRDAAAANEDLAEVLRLATTPEPLRPELTRPVLDSWTLTSLKDHAGRPDVGPWLRGWVDDEPQTSIVWRNYLPTRSCECGAKEITDYFEATPIHMTEKLETSSNDVFTWLQKRAKAILKLHEKQRGEPSELLAPDDTVAILLSHKGDVLRKLALQTLLFDGGKAVQGDKKDCQRELGRSTLIVDARFGGMGFSDKLSTGLLDPSENRITPAADLGPEHWLPQSDVDRTGSAIEPVPAFRVTLEAEGADASNSSRPTLLRMPLFERGGEVPRAYLLVEKLPGATTSEESRSTVGLRSMYDHHNDTEQIASEIAARLNLPEDLTLALKIAARNHDHGKDCDRWQNAFSAPDVGRPYAKTNGPFRNSLLDGFRHELHSLAKVGQDADFEQLSDELQDLTLHLAASHHGFARPVIRPDGCPEAPTVVKQRLQDIALRFASLQQRYGPWGLAWLESLMRAADQLASAIVDDASQGSERSANESKETTNG